MDEMRIDDQFVTEKIIDYLISHKIKHSQPTPYEHGQNGDIEVLIKHSQETVVKLLDSAQLAPENWSLALLLTPLYPDVFSGDNRKRVSVSLLFFLSVHEF